MIKVPGPKEDPENSLSTYDTQCKVCTPASKCEQGRSVAENSNALPDMSKRNESGQCPHLAIQ